MKVKLLIMVFVLLGTTITAQNPFLINRYFGGTNGAVIKDIKIFNNNYYILGYGSSTNGDAPQITFGGNDIWLYAMTNSGNFLYTKYYGHSGHDEAYQLIVLPDSQTFAITGRTNSIDGIFSLNHGQYDIFTIYVDIATGNLIRSKLYGGTDNDIAQMFYKRPTNKLAYFSTSHSGGGDVPCSTISLKWFFETDTAGNLIKSLCKTHPGSIYPFFFQNSVYVATVIADSTTYQLPFPPGGNSPDFMLYKMDTAYNILWQKHYGSHKNESINDAILTSDNHIVMFGSTESPLDTLDFPAGWGNKDFTILKVDTMGNLIWAKRFGTLLPQDYPIKILETPDSGFIFIGTIKEVSGNAGFNWGSNSNIWLVKLDKNGNLLWERTFGGSMGATPLTFAIDTDGSIIVVANTASTDGNLTGISNPLGKALWFFKLAPWVGMEETGKINHLIPVVYPNPATSGSNLFIRQLPEVYNDYQFQLFDITGRMVSVSSFQATGSAQITLPHLSAGMFFYRIESKGGIVGQGKIIVR